MDTETVTLEHGKAYELGAGALTYDAHTDTFLGGNYFVPRAKTTFKDAIGATLEWYKLVRDGEETRVWQDGIVPTIWGKLNYRLYRLAFGEWVQIGGRI